MKYRIAIALAEICDWIDFKVFDHGARQPFIWLSLKIWGAEAYVDRGDCWFDFLFWYPLCHWESVTEEWAGKMRGWTYDDIEPDYDWEE